MCRFLQDRFHAAWPSIRFLHPRYSWLERRCRSAAAAAEAPGVPGCSCSPPTDGIGALTNRTPTSDGGLGEAGQTRDLAARNNSEEGRNAEQLLQQRHQQHSEQASRQQQQTEGAGSGTKRPLEAPEAQPRSDAGPSVAECARRICLGGVARVLPRGAKTKPENIRGAYTAHAGAQAKKSMRLYISGHEWKKHSGFH